jgi:hypothetical protein
MGSYQADFICTYKFMENEEDQEQLYRIQLLQAFDLNEWNDEIINAKMEELYQTVANEFKTIFIKARENKNINQILSIFKLNGEMEDNDIIFKALFNYDYFDLIHRCLVDYFLNNTINSIYLDNLINAL